MMLSFTAILSDKPFPDELIRGELNSPQLHTLDDFSAYRAMSKETWVPILLSFSQKYKLMDQVLAAVEKHLGEYAETVLMSCRVPGTMRFPNRFNADKVFLVADIEAESRRLASRGHRFLSIYEGLVRHPMEIGDNSLKLNLYNCQSKRTKQDFEACKTEILGLGFSAERSVAA